MAPVLIPQSLAFAQLAGLPAHHGLYAAILPPIAASLLASSPYLQTGPVAMTSLLTLGVLSALAPPGSGGYVALAALLALMVGLARLGIGLARWGWLSYLMSQPVLLGFTNAAAVLIVAAQLPALLGLSAAGGGLLVGARTALLHPAEWNPAAMGVAGATFVIVFGGRRLHKLFPGVLIAVVAGAAAARIAGYDGPVVGSVVAGFPPMSLDLPWGAVPTLLVPAIVVALVGFAEPAAIARTYAAMDRQPWSPDREFVSQGAANIVAGLSGGFPVGGSFSRTAVTRLAGGRTRWSGAVAGLVTLAVLPFADLLASVPQAIIAAVIVVSVVRMFALVSLAQLARYSRPQAALGWLMFGLTLALAPRLDQAVILGVGFAVAVHIWRELQVQVRVAFADGTLVLEPQGVLFFGSAPTLETVLGDALARHPTATRLVLDLEELGRIDYSGGLALRNVIEEAERAGLTVEVRSVPPQAQRVLERLLSAHVGRRPVV